MTSYGASIDKSEGGQGIRFSAVVGSGGVTQGYPVKYDGSTAGTVVASTATSDIIVGIAGETGAEGASILVFGPGCKVKVPFTLTIATKVGVGTSGTAGTLVDYSTGTIVGVTEKSATLASVIRINLQY